MHMLGHVSGILPLLLFSTSLVFFLLPVINIVPCTGSRRCQSYIRGGLGFPLPLRPLPAHQHYDDDGDNDEDTAQSDAYSQGEHCSLGRRVVGTWEHTDAHGKLKKKLPFCWEMTLWLMFCAWLYPTVNTFLMTYTCR